VPFVRQIPSLLPSGESFGLLRKFSLSGGGRSLRAHHLVAPVSLVLILVALIAFVVVATAWGKLNPFLALLLAALMGGLAYGIPLADLPKTIGTGFGNTLGGIGIVIALGTIIGVILEKSGGAISMAEGVIALIGQRFPTLTISIIGYIVSIPVFCDSGFVILNSLKNALAKRMRVSVVAMSVALATGLYATHTFVPPTPGPIAAAGNLGLANNLGLVILVGLVVAAVSALGGLLWANIWLRKDDHLLLKSGEGSELTDPDVDYQALRGRYGEIPGAARAFAPILVPILLICLGSIAAFPANFFGQGALKAGLMFLGHPILALLIGLACALPLLKPGNRREAFADQVQEGLVAAAPILLITGAGGAFGAVLSASPLGAYLGQTLSALGLGLFMPYLVAAALKSAQGSTTVALITTSALMAPILPQIGLDSEMGRVLTVMAIGAGGMTVSHVNDSFFWVVSQFSRFTLTTAFKAQTGGTLVQGAFAMLAVWVLSLAFL
jgi:GntP family gluconate:H+ symporter